MDRHDRSRLHARAARRALLTEGLAANSPAAVVGTIHNVSAATVQMFSSEGTIDLAARHGLKTIALISSLARPAIIY
jgi:hypothetical protein